MKRVFLLESIGVTIIVVLLFMAKQSGISLFIFLFGYLWNKTYTLKALKEKSQVKFYRFSFMRLHFFMERQLFFFVKQDFISRSLIPLSLVGLLSLTLKADLPLEMLILGSYSFETFFFLFKTPIIQS